VNLSGAGELTKNKQALCQIVSIRAGTIKPGLQGEVFSNACKPDLKLHNLKPGLYTI
jgi:hypothetical protein